MTFALLYLALAALLKAAKEFQQPAGPSRGLLEARWE
jgi:hypothetical protein